MSTIAKPKTNIFAAIGSLFSSGIDIDGDEEIKLSTELSDALKALSNKEASVEQAINTNNNSTKKGGFGKTINPNTEKAMRAMHKEVKQQKKDDKGKEER